MKTNFETDVFTPITGPLRARFPSLPTSHLNIFADHLRTSVVLSASVFPSSKGRGYVLRKIIRRLLQFAYLNGIEEPFLASFVPLIVSVMRKLDEAT